MTLNKWDVIFVVVAEVLTLLITLSVGDKTYDDAYITFRYARNLALGQGFVFNSGENFLGTTTPLFTLLLALFGWLFSVEAIPLFGQWLTGIALFFCSFLVYFLGREDHKPFGGLIAALLILVNPVFVETWGGEALLLLALVLAAFYFYFKEYEALPAAFLALAFLTRGEGVLAAFVLYTHFIIVHQKFPWRAALAFSAVLIPWVIYALVTFGSPLPSTLPAKIAQMQSGYWAPFLRTSLEWLAAYIIKTPHFSSREPHYSYFVVVALAALGGWSLLLRPQFRWWAILIWIGLYAAGYSLLGVPFYHWYVAPLALGGLVLAGLGAQFGYNFIRQVKFGYAQYRNVALIIFIATLALPLITAAGFIKNYAAQPLCPQCRLYTRAGIWLREHTPPTASVGYFEIGFMGYYADRAFIDPVGLINPRVAERVAHGNLKWAYQYYKPDYLVIHPARWYDRIGNIREEPWFQEAYREVTSIAETGYEPQLVIYQKIDDAAIPTLP